MSAFLAADSSTTAACSCNTQHNPPEHVQLLLPVLSVSQNHAVYNEITPLLSRVPYPAMAVQEHCLHRKHADLMQQMGEPGQSSKRMCLT